MRTAITKQTAARTRPRRGTITFAALLGARRESGLQAIEAIRQGFEVRTFKEASAFFEIPETRLFRVVGMAVSSAHRLEKARRRADPATSERLYRISALTQRAIEVFGDEDKARTWMTRPNLTLGQNAPLELMDTEVGAQAVRRILTAIETGG